MIPRDDDESIFRDSVAKKGDLLSEPSVTRPVQSEKPFGELIEDAFIKQRLISMVANDQVDLLMEEYPSVTHSDIGVLNDEMERSIVVAKSSANGDNKRMLTISDVYDLKKGNFMSEYLKPKAKGKKAKKGNYNALGVGHMSKGKKKKKVKKAKEVNPWAICTSSVGREDKEKYESCVMQVKRDNNISKSMTEREFKLNQFLTTSTKKSVQVEPKKPMKFIIKSKNLKKKSKKVDSDVKGAKLKIDTGHRIGGSSRI